VIKINQKSHVEMLLAVALATLPPAVGAQTATWQVIGGEHSDVLMADLPLGMSRDFNEVLIGNSGSAQFWQCSVRLSGDKPRLT